MSIYYITNNAFFISKKVFIDYCTHFFTATLISSASSNRSLQTRFLYDNSWFSLKVINGFQIVNGYTSTHLNFFKKDSRVGFNIGANASLVMEIIMVIALLH